MPSTKFVIVEIPVDWDPRGGVSVETLEAILLTAKEAVKVRAAEGLEYYCVKETRREMSMEKYCPFCEPEAVCGVWCPLCEYTPEIKANSNPVQANAASEAYFTIFCGCKEVSFYEEAGCPKKSIS